MKYLKNLLLGAGLVVTALMVSCTTGSKTQLTESGLNPTAFDTTINNKPVKLYTLRRIAYR